MTRRKVVLAVAGLVAAALGRANSAWAQTLPATGIRRLGMVTLLGDSVRIYARDNREALFKDIGMDAIALEVAGQVVQAAYPQAELERLRAAGDVDIDDQIAVGTAAGRRGTLPDWVLKAAREGDWSHVLLIGSDTGPMEFRTGLTQVVGNGKVSGVGFWVGADYRWKNNSTGVTHNGYLAPFVQLRVSLIDLNGPRVLRSVRVSEGYAAGPAENEAPNPWNFLDRQQKAKAVQGLLRRNAERAVQRVLQPE